MLVEVPVLEAMRESNYSASLDDCTSAYGLQEGLAEYTILVDSRVADSALRTRYNPSVKRIVKVLDFRQSAP